MEVDGRDGTGAESHLREGCAPPSFEFRFETAKLIMELEDDARDSLAILEGLLDENDASLHLLDVRFRGNHRRTGQTAA